MLCLITLEAAAHQSKITRAFKLNRLEEFKPKIHGNVVKKLYVKNCRLRGEIC